MKKLFEKCLLLVCIALFLALFFSGCNVQQKIEGYWISGDEKYSVSFDGENTIVVDDKYIGEYEVFDENKIAINVDTPTFDEYLDLSISATFTVSDDNLVIVDEDKGVEYVFYTKDKAEKIINRAYKEKADSFNGIQEFSSPEDLGYFDDKGNLIRTYDWIIDESDTELYDYVGQVREYFSKEVLSFYQTKSPEGKYHVFDNGLFGVEGTLFYGLELRREGAESISIVNRYIIEPKAGLIYVQEDVNADSYKLWDGTVVYGKSLLDD